MSKAGKTPFSRQYIVLFHCQRPSHFTPAFKLISFEISSFLQEFDIGIISNDHKGLEIEDYLFSIKVQNDLKVLKRTEC